MNNFDLKFLNFSLSTKKIEDEKNAALFRAAFCQIILNSDIPEYYVNNLGWLALAQNCYENISESKHFSVGDSKYHIADFELFLKLVEKHKIRLRLDIVPNYAEPVKHKGIYIEDGEVHIPVMYDREDGTIGEVSITCEDVPPLCPVYKAVEAFPAIEEVMRETVFI